MFICFFTLVVSVILTNLYHYCYYYLVIIVVIIAIIIINYLLADLCTLIVRRSAADLYVYVRPPCRGFLSCEESFGIIFRLSF